MTPSDDLLEIDEALHDLMKNQSTVTFQVAWMTIIRWRSEVGGGRC